MTKVVKFGGSSLASAEQFQKAGDIIRSDGERRYVVPSAPGKRFSDDTKVTDLLYKCYDEAVAGEGRYKEILEQENALIQDQLDNIREINEIDRKNNAIEAYDKTDLNDKDITKIQDRITNRQSYIERLNSDIESFNQSIADAEQRLQNAGKNSREWKRAQEDIAYYTSLITDSEIERAKAEEEITEKIEQIIAYQEAGVALGKEGFTNDRDAMDIIEKLAPLYVD